jgi:hypothetical protein
VPRISLNVIARDEERFLGPCLASARAAVDEIVVVDTGSRDRTRVIAAESGARVVDLPWSDDFSAARNAALAASTGTHVLVLDADERLAGDALALRQAADDPRFTVGLLALHDASALDATPADVIAGRARLWEPCFVPRFFVRDPRLTWSRRVHETLFGDPAGVAALLRERASRIEALDAAIVHYGEVPALRAERSKRARNTRLLEAALADDPSDGDLAGFLAMELVRAGDTRRAREIGERHLAPFLDAIEALPSDAPRPSPVQLASVLATCLVQDGECARALDVVRAAHARCVEPHPNLRFLEGAALERLGRAEEAVRAYSDCVAMQGRRFTIPVNPGATGIAPRLRLANLALIAGDARAALDHLDRAGATTRPFETPAALLRAEALLLLREPARALGALEPLLARANPPPDLFALAGIAARALGAADPTLHATARQAAADVWIEPRRRAWVEDESGHPEEQEHA